MLQTSTVGAVSYLAPEVMGGMMYTTHSDVFSYAVCAWELITGVIPYEKERFVFFLYWTHLLQCNEGTSICDDRKASSNSFLGPTLCCRVYQHLLEGKTRK